MSHPELCTVDLAQSRSAVAGHQAPWATIIACADSRVAPELVFGGHGVGELFIARDAGNLVGVETLGTIEYGAAVLGSPLVVILAHTACGAVKAACDIVTKNATYPGVIGRMIEPIVPAALKVRNDPGDFVDNAAKESAKRTAATLPTVSKIVSDRWSAGKVKIVAAIYDLANRRRHLSRLAARPISDRRYEASLAENDRALRAAGHWGVPTMVFEGEPFFGQDRFDILVWRMKQRGLEPRPLNPVSLA